MTEPYQAYTKYGVPIISGSFPDRRSALWWIEREGARWPGSKIIQKTARGDRVIWRQPLMEAAA